MLYHKGNIQTHIFQNRSDGAPAQRELVIKGYESIRKLEGNWFTVLEGFAVMVMIENYCHHAPDPRETEGLKAEQPYALAIINNYLNGEPFLFNAIEVKTNFFE